LRRSKLGLGTGLGLSVLGWAALVGWAKRSLVADPPPAELEAALDQWLAQVGLKPLHRFVATSVGRVHVLLTGQGQQVVLVLPGLGASGGEFAELIARLGRHHRVAAVDLPGTGLSDPIDFRGHPGPPWNEVIAAVARELGIAQFSLVGHSLGGLAAGSYALAHPEQVPRLILVSPLGLSRRVPILWNLALLPGVMELRGWYERVLLLRRDGARGSASAKRFGGEPGRIQNHYRLLAGLRFGRGADLELIRRLLHPFRLKTDSQLLPALGLLAERTLVLWGGHDRRLSLRDARRELDFFKDLRLEVVPGAGHLLPVTEPNLTAQLITDFLATGEG